MKNSSQNSKRVSARGTSSRQVATNPKITTKKSQSSILAAAAVGFQSDRMMNRVGT